MRIAIMALQGDFLEHERMLRRLGVDYFEIRQKADWQLPKDGLILPGGESTTQVKLLRDLDMLDDLRRDIAAGLPVYGTCAGLILLSKEQDGKPADRIATMDINVRRNAYGRQLGSFTTMAEMKGIDHKVPMTFIRAPYIISVGDGVEVLAEVDGNIVAARQGNQLVTAFHPELNNDTAIHESFIKMAGASPKPSPTGEGSRS